MWEMTLEGRINRFGDEMFDRALEGGFNRFSFGIQSFNTQVRRSAKRLDDREVVLERISALSRTEQAPIVLDLLYGLPYQLRGSVPTRLRRLHVYWCSRYWSLTNWLLGVMLPAFNLVEKGKFHCQRIRQDKVSMYLAGVEFMAKNKLSNWAWITGLVITENAAFTTA